MNRKTLIACSALALLFALIQTLFVGMTNDTEMLMHTSAHMLSGGGLYTRWITVNSPVIYFIYALPVLLSTHLGLAPAAALHGFTALSCAASVALTALALRERDIEPAERTLWVAAALGALFAAPCIFHTFADREHYLFILSLPWIMPMLLRKEPSPAAGFLAMAGFCIKPYNLLVFVGVTLFGGPAHRGLKERLASPAFHAGAACFLSYLLLLAVFFPAYPRMFVIALSTYSTVAFSLASRVADVEPYFALITVAAAGLRPSRRLPFLALGYSAAGVYCCNAGWIYVAYVMSVPALLLCAGLWISGAEARFRSHIYYARLLAATGAAAAISLAGFNLGRDAYYTGRTGYTYSHSHFQTTVKKELRKNVNGDFILLSVNLWSSNLAALDGTYQSLFPFDDSPWPLAWVYRHRGEPKADRIWQTAFVGPLLEALQSAPPPALIVDDSPGQFVNLFGLLKQERILRPLLDDYSVTESIDHCTFPSDLECRFTIRLKKGNLLSH